MDGGTYQIRVRGRITRRWIRWFDGMTITVCDETGASPTTALTGPVADQAALHGLLQKLYTLGLPLLSVRQEEAHGTDDPDHR
jgi:hypothetical protein